MQFDPFYFADFTLSNKSYADDAKINATKIIQRNRWMQLSNMYIHIFGNWYLFISVDNIDKCNS